MPGLNQVLCGAVGGLIAGEALGRSARPSTWPGAWLGYGQPWLTPTWSSGRGAANPSRLLLCCLPALPPRSRFGAEFAEGRQNESINVGVYLAAGLALAWWCECTVCKHGVKASPRPARMGQGHGPSRCSPATPTTPAPTRAPTPTTATAPGRGARLSAATGSQLWPAAQVARAHPISSPTRSRVGESRVEGRGLLD